MPSGDPWDRFFYPTLTLMIDPYNSQNCYTKASIFYLVSVAEQADLSLTWWKALILRTPYRDHPCLVRHSHCLVPKKLFELKAIWDWELICLEREENVNCHKILITDQVLLKLYCGIDKYLYLPSVGTKHIKANDKQGFEAFLQCYCLEGILSVLYKCKVWNGYKCMLSLCETTNVFIDALCYSKIHFISQDPLN